MMPPSRISLFSVGHSNRDVARFVGLLKRHHINTLVDVRSAPYSRFCPQFNRSALERMMADAGFQYVYMGDRLGGMPKGDAFYDEAGHVRYDVVAAAPFFIEGIRRLVELASDRRCAMMCAEEDPRHCHRHKLVEPALIAAGIDIKHIRGDGRIESPEDLEQRDDPDQLSLF